MDIAEKKLSENDYVGAKKYVIQAQNLYPKLDGLEQMSMIIHVFVSASNKINTGGKGEETDWYGVLCVDPEAGEESVKKQYKKLALLLHPDKNRFKGAEDACKLVLEAWSLLSDKAKRLAYDQKRKSNEVKTGMQKPPNPQKPAAGNQNAGDGVDPSANATSHKPAPGPPPVNSPKQSKGGSFWTMCSGCQSLCEYLRGRYLNKVIRCPNCDKTFTATENNFWGSIVSEVDLRLSRLRQQAAKNNTNGASSFGTSYQPGSGTTQKPQNAYKPASSNWNHGVDPNAYATSYSHAPPPAYKPASSSWWNQNASHGGVDPNAYATSNNPSKQSKGGYFWTACNGCQSLCEYLRDDYLNKAIRCPNCDQTFIATDNSFYGNIIREVDSRLSLIRRRQNTSGATYYPSSSGSFHQNSSASVPANTANETPEILKRILDMLDEVLAAAVVGWIL